MRKQISVMLLLFTLLLVAFTSCEKRVRGVGLLDDSVTLYVGDSEHLLAMVFPDDASNRSLNWSSNNTKVATVSNDGVAKALTSGTATISVTTADGGYTASCVLTVSPDIYVAGYEKNSRGKSVATIWKNAKPQRLSDGYSDASATSIFVIGDDIFVAGTEGDFSKKRAVLWKNGKKILESNLDGFNVGATSVIVSGNDVYMTGTATNVNPSENGAAMLWKNGRASILATGQMVSANSVFLSGKDVYVAGGEGNFNNSVATLWKNGTAQRLASHDFATMASAHSVCVSDKDVYVTGYEVGSGKFQPVLWKNGVPKAIGNANPMPPKTEIIMAGNHLIVAISAILNGITEFWQIDEKNESKINSVNAEFGSLYAWESPSDGKSQIYFVGSEERHEKWYAVVGKVGLPSSENKIQRLTDGLYQAEAHAVFVRVR